jgi:hypothetical protein
MRLGRHEEDGLSVLMTNHEKVLLTLSLKELHGVEGPSLS